MTADPTPAEENRLHGIAVDWPELGPGPGTLAGPYRLLREFGQGGRAASGGPNASTAR